ncbi:hypothetical protein BDN70DRAFT_881763 [Pholiota conissans]|uniref:Uncharacterized protein n=1 Tax=Pholiota conissans TaxID=109636 RepID=A0A9P5YXJ6_9AGAR|nr:hypothetical protein BDN70DRAFT_881763 [Pholiota conissans]
MATRLICVRYDRRGKNARTCCAEPLQKARQSAVIVPGILVALCIGMFSQAHAH